MKRVLVAVAIAAGIYGLILGAGGVLYATDNIATGATHNDCGALKREIADRDFDGDQEAVSQEQLKAETIACLAEHELTPREAFRSEYLIWGAWPGVICAVIFLLWPVWTKILLNQEEVDLADDAANKELGT
jgi:hypothetical protein